MTSRTFSVPREFILSRLHSLFGLMIVLFLVEHLLTNSQAALFMGEEGAGFIRAVNWIHNLPYLSFVEIFFIGVPILYHAIMGVRIALKGKFNSFGGAGGTQPLIHRGRNRAYTWQRLSSWVLLVGIALHVGYMRFYLYPSIVPQGGKKYYFTRVDFDPGQYALAERFGFTIYNKEAIDALKKSVPQQEAQLETLKNRQVELNEQQKESQEYIQEMQELINHKLELENKRTFIDQGLCYRSLEDHQVILATDSFGTSQLMNVRDAFKSPISVVLYTIFVLAAAFHGFNGLWTFCITWGIVIKSVSQRKVLAFCCALMAIIAALGLVSIWGSYLDTLRS